VTNRTLWILSIIAAVLIAGLLLVSGFTGWMFDSERIFSVPGELVSYDTILNDYWVNVEGMIPEKQVQEIFTILKNIYGNADTGWHEGALVPMVKLEVMTIKAADNGNVRVVMSDWGSRITERKYGVTLEFRRTWMGKWVLVNNKDPDSV
jgi:hypothetical protein